MFTEQCLLHTITLVECVQHSTPGSMICLFLISQWRLNWTWWKLRHRYGNLCVRWCWWLQVNIGRHYILCWRVFGDVIVIGYVMIHLNSVINTNVMQMIPHFFSMMFRSHCICQQSHDKHDWETISYLLHHCTALYSVILNSVARSNFWALHFYCSIAFIVASLY